MGEWNCAKEDMKCHIQRILEADPVRASHLALAKNTVTIGRPAVYGGSFSLTKTGDTFLDMRDWGKGIVFINGINIGRYWSVGPQQTLYLPGCWLKKGKNEIVVFEQNNDVLHKTIKSVGTPVLESLKPDSVIPR